MTRVRKRPEGSRMAQVRNRPGGAAAAVDLTAVKKAQMGQLAQYRRKLYREPILRYLFLELTLRCNEHCLHCGSSCGDVPSEEMSLQQYRQILDQIREDFDVRRFQLCITGGEPLLRRDFFDIMGYAHALGYVWGMTSNATLITPEVAARLKETGMKTISVSVDGLEASHNAFRQTPDAYRRAMTGIQNLIDQDCFENIQITSVMNHQNIHELEDMFREFDRLDIDSWRVIGIEPMGRALQHPELLLTEEDQKYLFDFIRSKRMQQLPVTYGCSHFLGYTYEREVREKYFLCNAGIYTASICCNGDIIGCLDIERRPELVQGNILTDRFKEVWEERFAEFRYPLSERTDMCKGCEYEPYCAGGARHSYDYDHRKQRICFRDTCITAQP